jgi:hypothetical protein
MNPGFPLGAPQRSLSEGIGGTRGDRVLFGIDRQTRTADETQAGVVETVIRPVVDYDTLESITPYQMFRSMGNSALTTAPAWTSQCPK